MANVGNVNAPQGLRPVGTLGSAGYCGRIEVFATLSTDSAAIGVGDPVINTGEADANGIPVVKRFTSNGTSGAPMVGVMLGIVPNPLDLAQTYRKAYTDQYVLVDTDPNTVYEVADSSTAQTTCLAASDIGSNITAAMGTVNTTTGNGNTVLGTTKGTTTNLELKILRLSPKVGNLIGDYAKYQVLINNHVYQRATGSAGI